MTDNTTTINTDDYQKVDVSDLIRTRNTDGMQWALAFRTAIDENNFTIEDVRDPSLMVGWFANAIMTQYDKGCSNG